MQNRHQDRPLSFAAGHSRAIASANPPDLPQNTPKEIAMNPMRTIGRLACMLTALAAALATAVAAARAAFAATQAYPPAGPPAESSDSGPWPTPSTASQAT
jgi:hypothetical protein